MLRNFGIDPFALGLFFVILSLIALFIIGALIYYGKTTKKLKLVIALIVFSLMFGFSLDMVISIL